jgi:lipopolysaccharide biosynthesis glycosyltransferase
MRTAVALAVDDRYALPAAALVRSLVCHAGLPARTPVVVLTAGLDPVARDVLAAAARETAGLRLEVRRLSAWTGGGDARSATVAKCLRLFLGEACRDVDRVLYLDADMLALADVGGLLATDLRGRTVAAVVNHPPLDTVGVALRRRLRGEVPGERPYFNAGLLLVDTARWLRRGVGARARAFLSAHPGTRLLDQDALNVALAGDWRALPRAWNTPAGDLTRSPVWPFFELLNPGIRERVDEWREAQEAPRVLHYTGEPKPWDPSYPWPALREQYLRYAVPGAPLAWPPGPPPARRYSRV